MTTLGLVSTIITARLYGVRIIGEFALVTVPVAALWALSSVKEQQALIKEITRLPPRHPRVTQLFAACANAPTEVIVNAIGHVELLIFWPTIVSLRESDLLLAQGFTVCPAGILLVRRTVPDMAVHDDQRRTVFAILKGPECAGQHLEIVCVANPRDISSVSDETRGYVLGEGLGSVAFNRDVVVVVDPA